MNRDVRLEFSNNAAIGPIKTRGDMAIKKKAASVRKKVVAVSAPRPKKMAAAKKASPNERNTENIVRGELRKCGFYDDNPIQVEEQKSGIDAVKRLLKGGSKAGGTGQGFPEFIISSSETPDIILVVECKAQVGDHESPIAKSLLAGVAPVEDQATRNRRVSKFAVDGVLHYARLLSKEFHVIAVAVSGETDSSATVSTFLHSKGANVPRKLVTKLGASIDSIIPWPDYVEHATFDPQVRQARYEDLMQFARDLHDFMRDHAKLSESEKPLLVSGTLIALRNRAFAASYHLHSPEDLQREWMKVIKDEMDRTTIPSAKKDNMIQPYSGIAVHPELGKATKAFPKGVLHELVKQLHEHAAPFIQASQDLDILGQFYGEFLKYTGGDKKALGIVLTPRHITELFAYLANVDKDSTVLDICAGTGGFLISAMSQMMRTASTEKQRERIKAHGLIGVEQQPHMFALAASNMILRGDGKANLYQGDCLNDAITRAIKGFKADVGLLNPPFSQSDDGLHELRFVKHMMDCLRPGAIGIAIVPMNRVISPHVARRELLANHTLEAVMSLPDELFYPVGTITCALVLTAHVSHAKSNRKTWFAYWKDDGFIKTKHRGRISMAGDWPEVRDAWVEAFRNRDDVPGLSIKRAVTAEDEWCAEAYMETDYAALAREDYERTVKKYFLFQLVNEAEEKALLAAEGKADGGVE